MVLLFRSLWKGLTLWLRPPGYDGPDVAPPAAVEAWAQGATTY